jgi:hypothetical protein
VAVVVARDLHRAVAELGAHERPARLLDLARRCRPRHARSAGRCSDAQTGDRSRVLTHQSPSPHRTAPRTRRRPVAKYPAPYRGPRDGSDPLDDRLLPLTVGGRHPTRILARMQASRSAVARRSLRTTTRSAWRDSCFLAKKQSWRNAWRARSLQSRTNMSSSRHATRGEMLAAPLIRGRLHRPGAHVCSGRAARAARNVRETPASPCGCRRNNRGSSCAPGAVSTARSTASPAQRGTRTDQEIAKPVFPRHGTQQRTARGRRELPAVAYCRAGSSLACTRGGDARSCGRWSCLRRPVTRS